MNEQVLQEQRDIRRRLRHLERLEAPGGAASALMGGVSLLQSLPALRGLWPFSTVDASGNAVDLSGLGNNLAAVNTPIWATNDMMPAVFLISSSSQYFSTADAAAFDITGGEGYINTGRRGLTLGGWFRFTTSGISEALIAKWAGGTSTDNSYLLQKFSGDDHFRFHISSSGTNYVVGSPSAPEFNVWTFVAGRYRPSTELKIWHNDETNTNTTSIPATINNGGESFAIGARTITGTPADFMDGRASMCFLCAAAVPDAVIETFYHQTKELYV